MAAGEKIETEQIIVPRPVKSKTVQDEIALLAE